MGKSGYSSIASLTMFKSPISVFIANRQFFRNITGYERPASEMVHFVYYDPTRNPDWTVVIFDANVSNAMIVQVQNNPELYNHYSSGISLTQ